MPAEWSFSLTPALPAPTWGALHVLAEGWDIGLPQARQTILEPISGHGVIDLSTALSNGEPIYDTRLATIPIWIEPNAPAAGVGNLHAAHQWLSQIYGRHVSLQVSSLPGWHLDGRLDATDVLVDDLSGDVDATLQITAQPLWQANQLTGSAPIKASAAPGTALHLDPLGHTVPLTVTATGACQIASGGTMWQIVSGAQQPDGLVLDWQTGVDLAVIGATSVSAVVSYRAVRL